VQSEYLPLQDLRRTATDEFWVFWLTNKKYNMFKTDRVFLQISYLTRIVDKNVLTTVGFFN